MLKTPLGYINIFVNGKIVRPIANELPSIKKGFIVDKCYQLSLNISLFECEKTIIECVLAANDYLDNLESNIESGEKLEMISFYCKNTKLSIGTEGEIQYINYSYLANGIQIEVSNEFFLKKVVFNVAWLTMTDSDVEDIYTWFAADPTINF